MVSKLISHEIPFDLLKDHQNSISDYLYVLLHLIIKDEAYLEYTISYKKKGGVVYLDNSCFELGESLDSGLLYEYYKKISPNVVILPDKLGYKTDTIKRSLEFLEKYPDTIEQAMPVIQGNSIDEMLECYREFSKIPGLQYIAIPFVYSWVSKDAFIQASERVSFIDTLHNSSIINKKLKHHLLGTWLPQEFVHYRNYDWIYSIDTSSPIMAAIEGTSYTNLGIQSKPKPNLDSVYNKKVDDIDMDLLYHNVRLFRKLVNNTK